MTINLNNLSYEELTILEKQIKENKKERMNNDSAFYKLNLHDDCLYDILKRRFPVEDYGVCKTPNTFPDYSEPVFKIASQTYRSLCTLCDIALENYHAGASNERGQRKVLLNGSIVQKNQDEYRAMYNELWTIFLKYADKGEQK